MKKFLLAFSLVSWSIIFAQSTITVTSPNGGEKWQLGKPHFITWTSTGAAANVKIECSTDGGITYPNLVTASVSATLGSYSFDFSVTPSSQCRIRISDAANPADFDVSDNDFTVANLALTSPVGPVHLQVGKVSKIEWASSQVTNVKLEYTTDNGNSWLTIASSIDDTSKFYDWTVPNLPSTGCKVKITDVSNSTIKDVSSSAFTIASLSLSSPNGGESFLTGSNQTITWSSQNVANIKIEYTTDGVTYNPIQNSVNASIGSYTWAVPAAVTSTNCSVRITDAAYAGVTDESNGSFTISSLSLTSPAGAEVWQGGSSHNITWTSTNITNVKIDYSTDNGVSWNSVANSVVAALGTYPWTVPNTPTFQAKVRISDLSYQSNNKVSNLFTLEPVPAIAVTSPNGNEKWQENTVHNITWTATYNIANVDIEYSVNNGVNWIPIAAGVAAGGGASTNYAWTVPNNYSQQCRVRVKNSANNTVNDASDNRFTIASLVLTAPNGGEKWQTGKQYNVTWTSMNISNVMLEYSSDNGTSWNTISASVLATNGTYAWTIPNSPTTQYLVRISDVSNSDINDVSAAVFTTASITVTSPNGGENWMESSANTVTWNSTNITNVKIDYTIDGINWNPIVASTAAAPGTYSWTTPAVSSTNYKIRISDAADNTISDQSDSVFTVSKISLTSPIGGENWKVGTSHDITWNSSSIISNIKLEYTTNNGSSWLTIAASVIASAGSYRWIVPNTTSINCKVRVSNVSSPDVNSVSAAFFTISKSLIIVSPNGGEKWEIGSSKNITWTRDPVVSFIRIQYTFNNGTSWNDINNYVDASLGTFAWTIPNTPSSTAKIKISDVNNVTNIDSSDAVFTIQATPTITITRPNGGESFETGALENITWNSGNVTNVKIEYSINNGASWNLIKSALPSTGSYPWSVPNINSSQCLVKITSEENSSVFDISDNKFTIVPRIVITSPNGGENLPVASSFPITWTSSNTANVKIDYSTDNGNNWTNITASTPAAAGSYNWASVPNFPSSSCLIKISDAIRPEVYDVSDNVFTISNKIKILSPNGNESWQSGSTKTITWQSTNVANVAISYSSNNGSAWTSITNSTPAANGSYSWTLPAISGNQYKIKISDVSNANVYDISDFNFTVTSLDLKTPNGGENYTIGSTQNITWTSSYISKVKLEYSINNGLDWMTIADTVMSNGLYYWQIPDSSSTQCKVRISDASNPATYDVSTNSFSIMASPSITVTYPNGKEELAIGKTEIIKWSSVNVSNVKIEYSVNNGTNWSVITSSTTSNGSYNWLVPNNPSSMCKIKISDVSRSGISDVSDSVFTISNSPKITVLTPNGGETLKGNASYSITWSSINVDNVKIESSVNNGVSWQTIVSSTPSTGLYIWNIPEESSYQCRIRISDALNNSINDISDNVFTIAVIKLYTPADNEIILSGSPYDITWKSECISNIKIEFSTNQGTSWSTIANSVNAIDGKYSWSVPNATSFTGRIKITNISSTNIFDMNNNDFTAKRVVVISPADNSNLKVGTTQIIQWKTINISLVKIEYTTDNGSKWSMIADSIPANLGSYSWTVPDSPSNYCSVKISDTNNSLIYSTNGTCFSIADLTEVENYNSKPVGYNLYQNYPNPFNPSTLIRYDIPKESYVSLKVYDILGRQVAVLVDGIKSAGGYSVIFNGNELGNGIYFYRIQAGSFIEVKKLLLMK